MYELFLKGRVLHTRRGGSLLEALRCFERAVGVDPDLADAHAFLGDAYRLLAVYGIKAAAETMPLARAAAERALAKDPNQFEALATLACIIAVYDWNTAEADAVWERGLAVNPSHVRALSERAINLSMSRYDVVRAVRDARHATELDPLNAWAAGMYAFVLAFTGRLEVAVECARCAVALDGDNFTARWSLVETLLLAGKHEEGLAAAEPALTMSGHNPFILTAVAGGHVASDNRIAADGIYKELHGRSRTSYIPESMLAATAAAANRLDDARALATRAVEVRDCPLVFWRDLPGWTPFRADPECAEILRQAGLPASGPTRPWP